MVEINLITREDITEIVSMVVKQELQKILDYLANSKQPQNEIYLTKQEAASFLHCSLVTLYNLEKKEKLIPLRIGRKILYPKSALILAMRGGEAK